MYLFPTEKELKALWYQINPRDKYDCGGVAQEWFEKIQNIYFGVKYHV